MASATLFHDIQQILTAEHPDPFRVLGMHTVSLGGELRLVVRTFQPGATAVSVTDEDGEEVAVMECGHEAGFFEAVLPRGTTAFPYRLRVTWPDAAAPAPLADADDSASLADADDSAPVAGSAPLADAFAFGPQIGEFDLYLMAEGTHLRLWDVLGAHPMTVDGVQGVHFGVWAPGARRVSVVGEFNQWDGRRHPMRLHAAQGVWEIFIPGVPDGALYRYEILPHQGSAFLKSDPLAFTAEVRPATASKVADLTTYEWNDAEWMRSRQEGDWCNRPMSIYEVHPGSWKRVPGEDDRPLTWREMAVDLVDYVAEMGFTHVEFLPVMEHPYDPSWGYQVTGYYAPTSRFGGPDDFRYLVDQLHQRGIGVILDWVPAHFPKDAFALRRFDGSALYEHADPRQGEHPEWGTLIFNFGRNEVRNFLISNALFWLDEYHADGLRVDAVASMLYLDYSRGPGQWIPNQYGGRENLEAVAFLQQLNTTVRDRHPGALMIAEESTAWPGVTQLAHLGGLGFHLKWNMGWMHDNLSFMAEEAIHRKYHFNLLTFSLMYAFSEKYVLPLSHDEVVHLKGSLMGKMPGDAWQKAANLRLMLGMMWGHPGKKLLFMGGEIGQWGEWNENRSLDWHLLADPLNAGVQRWMRDLNALYKREPAFWETDFSYEGFEWIDFRDVEQSVLSFVRRGGESGHELLFVCNFTPVPRHAYHVGAPSAGRWREVLNSDAEPYGGGNVGNGGVIETVPLAVHGREQALPLTLPPLGILILQRED